jgi:transposase-like protein
MLMCNHLNYEGIRTDGLMPNEKSYICDDCGKVFIVNSDGEVHDVE